MPIHKKLLEVQKLMPRIDKDAQNEFFSKGSRIVRYSTLSNVLNVVLPLINAKNILFTSEQKYIEGTGWVIIVELIDVDDASIKSTMLPLINLADMQKMGGCITYAQRYGLLPMLGIAPELDDDGNSVSQPNIKTIKSQPLSSTTKEAKEKLIKLFNDNKELLKDNDMEKYYTIESSLNENISLDVLERRLKWIESVVKAKDDDK